MKKKQNVSFASFPELKKRLKAMKHPSQWLRLVVTKELGLCPVCQGEWPNKKPVKAPK